MYSIFFIFIEIHNKSHNAYWTTVKKNFDRGTVKTMHWLKLSSILVILLVISEISMFLIGCWRFGTITESIFRARSTFGRCESSLQVLNIFDQPDIIFSTFMKKKCNKIVFLSQRPNLKRGMKNAKTVAIFYR